jgi:hypothetical protein
MEVFLGMHLHINSFNDLDFFEMDTKYERVNKLLEKKNSNKTNIADGSNFG